MYKVYCKEVPAIFDSYSTLNCDIHDYNTRQRCCIHVDQVKTNRRDMTMRIQGGKVWNSILLNDIDVNDNIYALNTVYPKKYAHGFCFAVLCCGYTWTGFPISIRLTSLALWQSNDCPSASKAALMNMDKYFIWIHYERLHNHNKAKHNKTVCIFLGIYCKCFMSHFLKSTQWILKDTNKI